MDSILISIKKLLMISADDASFDLDVMMHINSVIAILNQLGVGPSGGFTVTDDTATWRQLLGGFPLLDTVRTYVYLRVRLLFDPPSSGAVIESMNHAISELEWRINAAAEAITQKIVGEEA